MPSSLKDEKVLFWHDKPSYARRLFRQMLVFLSGFVRQIGQATRATQEGNLSGVEISGPQSKRKGEEVGGRFGLVGRIGRITAEWRISDFETGEGIQRTTTLWRGPSRTGIGQRPDFEKAEM